jgi:hypothetical protein
MHLAKGFCAATAAQLAAKAAKLQNQEVLGPVPEFTTPDGAGVPGCHHVAVMIAITEKDGEASGAYVNTAKGMKHRLEVVRILPLAGIDNDGVDRLCTRLPRDKDAVLDHTRPGHRHSLQMWRSAPRGMKNEKPWMLAYEQIEKAAEWTIARVLASHGTQQWGLLLTLQITDWGLEYPNNPRFKPYYQATVRAVTSVEIVELHEPGAQPECDAPEDDDTPPWEGASDIEET